MAYTTIDDPSAHHQVLLYTGNATGRSLTNTGNSDLQPDLVVVKDRSATNDWKVTDSSRLGGGSGPTRTLEFNTTGAEYDDQGEGSDATTSFNSDGFTIGTNGNYNTNNNTYAAWQWKSNGGSTTTNDASSTGVGSQDSVYQANTTSRFSIVTYGPLGSGGTIAHGLGVVPSTIWVKSRTGNRNWCVYHHKLTAAPETDFLSLDQNVATQDATVWNDTAPTSTVFSVSGDGKVGTDETYVAYCFADVKGYCKFGSYVGNASSEGPFVYTGFRPKTVLVKNTATTNSWNLMDSSRGGPNTMDHAIYTNSNSADSADIANWEIDFFSTGFKIRAHEGEMNGDGNSIIYMAWAEFPFVDSDGAPGTAR